MSGSFVVPRSSTCGRVRSDQGGTAGKIRDTMLRSKISAWISYIEYILSQQGGLRRRFSFVGRGSHPLGTIA